MDRYNIAICGAGSIGASKSRKFNNKEDDKITTWAKAAFYHPRCDLTALVDPNFDKAYDAHQEFGGQPFSSLQQMHIHNTTPDIFIISVPTKNHLHVLYELIQFQPKLVICEKPFCNSLKEAQEAQLLYKKYNIPLAVDYLRRFNKAYQDLKTSFDNDTFGKIFSCICYYTRGFIRDGSHFINLAQSWFGRFKDGIILEDDGIDDYSPDDLTYEIGISFEKCNSVYMIPIDGRMYDVFDIHVHTEKGKIELLNHGSIIRFYKPVKEAIYGDYDSLGIDFISKDTGLSTTLLSVLDNCIAKMEGEEELICDGEDAVRTHEIIKTLLDSRK